ncbi:hypothetical protein Sme01_57970 [Sphaerisporangium melleum]|uniref:Uncharacterized protein n=1 Tax=Sphaerisporangium melleum TaxID=321316 RepID=A0A917R8T1_9ACTN|nr:hypothetical protein GCM10007964_41850 [Sphaerisporangium melleum]GII73321.1 hypothetical protein Sme01_57970 [Sphaerisporangium melleum]
MTGTVTDTSNAFATRIINRPQMQCNARGSASPCADLCFRVIDAGHPGGRAALVKLASRGSGIALRWKQERAVRRPK